MRRSTVRRALLLLFLGLLPAAARAQVPSAAHWRTLETAHFRVDYTTGLDSLARHTGAAAERAYARLAREFTRPPAGRIELILADNVDYSNGLTSAFPYNHIVLYARPPVGDVDLGYFPDWTQLLLDHELTHAFHLDRTSRFGHLTRLVFGRVPLGWPFFPVVGTPGWSLEGTAVFYESHLTGEGRIYGSYHDMVLRTATLEDGGRRFWTIDRLTGESPIWPAGDAAYIYGSYFLDYLAQRGGPDVQGRLAGATAGQLIPSFGTVARKVFHRSWPALYGDFRQTLQQRYAGVAAEVTARGITPGERLTRAGYYALHPRVSPDGRSVAFVAQDPRSTPETRLYDVASGRVTRISRRNSLDPVAWLPDGRLLTAQLELRDRYHVFSDLYTQRRGEERRLTHGRRLEQVDVSRDGRHAVAVEDSGGTTRLVVVEIAGGQHVGAARPLTPFDPAQNWAHPRWSPDGARLAVTHWTRGGAWDVVLLDDEGRTIRQVTRDRALDTGPAWSPDGRWLLWESDRSGIPNIYATRADSAGAVQQVTNVLGGAYWPDVSPDGRWLYYAGYHADGWHLERTPFEASRWLAPQAAREDSARVFPAVPADTSVGRARRYAPWVTLAPRFWIPAAFREAGGNFFGIATAGTDAIERHSYGITAAYDVGDRRAAWLADYEYAGLGNPVLGLSTSRGWDSFRAAARTATYEGVRREDDFALTTSFLRPRYRSSLALSAGADVAYRRRTLLDAPTTVRLNTPNDRLTGVFGGIGFANYQQHPFSISRENGVAVSLAGRRRWADTHAPDFDPAYSEASTFAAAYRGLALSGFAHHVLAARFSALARGGPGAEPEDIGGASGQTTSFGIFSAGTPGIFLPVRGYGEGVRSGTRAWTTSLEYRFPIALVGRGWGTSAWYLDQLAADAFVDAGNARCPGADSLGVARNGYLCSRPGLRPVVSSGAELLVDGRAIVPTTVRVRAGIGFPVSEGGGARGWVTIGSAF